MASEKSKKAARKAAKHAAKKSLKIKAKQRERELENIVHDEPEEGPQNEVVVNGVAKPKLFEPIQLRGLEIPNRLWMSPMCMYSVFNQDGRPTSFHYQHYVSHAFGGYGLITTESTAVMPNGRISPCDVGLWEDDMIDTWRWIVQGVHEAGAKFAIQLSHSGRKGSSGAWSIGEDGMTVPPELGGWQTVAPSAIPYGQQKTPLELAVDEIHEIEDRFRDAAWRAKEAGFDMIEIHAAHGYLVNQFLDPLTNKRVDQYGGSFENRIRFLLEVLDKVRSVIPDDMPVMVRVSATDWVPGGWNVVDSVELAKILKERGVDLIDVSSGGVLPSAHIEAAPGYQVGFAEQIRYGADMPVSAVGLITKAKQAEAIVADQRADVVSVGRQALREPSWPFEVMHKLGMNHHQIPYPGAYARGSWPDKKSKQTAGQKY